MGFAEDAERASAYLVDRVRAAAGARWAQGQHAPSLAVVGAGPSLETLARVRLWRVPLHVALGVVAWSHGERDVELLSTVPAPRHVLALQARGRRCVSLLPDDAVPSGQTGLDFALHDLCHLEKFVEPAHHAEQIGFFRRVDAAIDTAGWRAFDRRFDVAWTQDVEHVVADMNGSAIFLFAALKMKLKMAVRRELARAEGRPAPTGGPLSTGEASAFDRAQEELLALLGLDGDAAGAARAVSTKRDAPDAATRLQGYFASMLTG